jgi:hypothetical protein
MPLVTASPLAFSSLRMTSSFFFASDLVMDEIDPKARLRLCPPSHHCPTHFPQRFFKLPD